MKPRITRIELFLNKFAEIKTFCSYSFYFNFERASKYKDVKKKVNIKPLYMYHSIRNSNKIVVKVTSLVAKFRSKKFAPFANSMTDISFHTSIAGSNSRTCSKKIL